jgi:putative ABC transport system permease protein
MLIDLSVKSLLNRKWSVVLTVLSIALSTALLLGVERIRDQARSGFNNTISGTDLIVGAPGGSVQLLLASVFHLGGTSRSISWDAYEAFAGHEQVAWTIPLALGDSFKGFAVIGTTRAYLDHMKVGQKRALKLHHGEWFEESHQAVLGSYTASMLGLRPGDRIVLAHGAGDVSFIEHSDHPYTVSGVLEATGTPIDQTVLISLEGYDAMHAELNHAQDVHHHDPLAAALAGHEHEDEPAALTVFFVGLKDRAMALGMQRVINGYPGEALSAVMPAVALQELWEVVGVVENALMAISVLVVAVGLCGMLVALMTSLNERRREMAVLRSVGARPVQIFSLILAEACVLSCAGLMLGLVLVTFGLSLAAPTLLKEYSLVVDPLSFSSHEGLLGAGVLLAGMIAGVIPALQMTRLSLGDGLTVRV